MPFTNTQSTFLILYTSSLFAQEKVQSTIGPSSHLNWTIIKIIHIKNVQKCISQVIPDYVKLTTITASQNAFITYNWLVVIVRTSIFQKSIDSLISYFIIWDGSGG